MVKPISKISLEIEKAKKAKFQQIVAKATNYHKMNSELKRQAKRIAHKQERRLWKDYIKRETKEVLGMGGK